MAVQRPRSRAGRGSGRGGMLTVSMAGADQLADLSQRLREAGRKDLQRELRTELRKPPRELEQQVRAEIAPTMPRGYEKVLARSLKFKPRVRTRGPSTGVTVTVRASGTGKDRDVRSLDQGELRHPVFGRRRRTSRGRVFNNAWVAQSIPAGFFSRPARRVLTRAQDHMVTAMDRIAARIGGE